MKLKAIAAQSLSKPAAGAVLTVLCGWILWTSVGESLENVSYDSLFRFCARAPTNKVVLILMDNASFAHFNVRRTNPLDWKRSIHANLLERLAADGCPLVVFDVLFKSKGDTNEDAALSEAIRRQGHVLLTARLEESKFPGAKIAEPYMPQDQFLRAAAGWGIGKVDGNPGQIVRRHWPFPAPDSAISSLPWEAARLTGRRLGETPQHQWLRYYSQGQAWEEVSYHLACSLAPGYYHDKIVFVGSDPKTPELGDEDEDEFGTPYTRWTHESAGGVKILATTFLNLINEDWLRRPPGWSEILALGSTGVLLGAGLWQIGLRARWSLSVRLGAAFATALVAALAAISSAAWVSSSTNYWFPWLVIAGGQVPVAFAWAAACAFVARPGRSPVLEPALPPAQEAAPDDTTVSARPTIHGYEYLTHRPLGQGAFGEVWLVRSVVGEAQALKIVPLRKFGDDSWYGEAEFKAIQRYKPISNHHPGLLHIQHADFAKKSDGTGYFYYVMELGDSLVEDWEKDPSTYKPRNLATVRAQATGQRLPVRQCVDMALPLAEALDCIHQQGLTHRDIKPENIIFVRGRPKLADVGLVTNIRSPEQIASRPGTPGYMPPPPEQVGTVAADIYGFGMVLYVISTGRKPELFPMVKTTLAAGSEHAEFMLLNTVIIKACQPDPAERYASAASMHAALLAVQAALGPNPRA